MFIYKQFDSSKHLDDVQYQSLKIYGMASIRNGQDTPFVECATKAQAEEAKKQGRQIVAIRAIPFVVPFTSLGTEIHETHTRVNVSGAVTLRIKPDASFRDYVLSHTNGELTTNQLILEFAKGLELNLEPTLKHIVNTDDVEQIRKHGVEAADVSGLPCELPSWCEVVKVQLAVDGTDTASRYIQQVASVFAEQEKAAQVEQDRFINRIGKEVIPEWQNKSIQELKKGPLHVLSNISRRYYFWLVSALLGAWLLSKLVFILGGGSADDRKCRVDFENKEKTASSNLQMYLLKTHLADKFRQNETSKGKPFGGFEFKENYHFAEDDAVKVRDWVDKYVEDHHGILHYVENEYNHPHGIRKVLGWSKPYYKCNIGMEGKVTSDAYHLVVKQDYDGSVKSCLDEMFLTKGKTKGGITEYKSLKLRGGDVALLTQALQKDESLAAKGVIVQHTADHEIVVTVGNYTLNYQLNASELEKFNDLLDEIKSVFQAAVSKDVYFKQGKAETLPLTNSQVEKLQKALVVKDRVVFTREVVEEGKTERLVFKMSEKERKGRELVELDKQKRADWWNRNEQGLLDTVMDKAKRLEQAVTAIKVPEDATDADYAALLDRIQVLRAQRQAYVEELNNLLNKVKAYQAGMEKAILKKATAHQQQLEGQTATYMNMKEQLDNLTTKIHNARWEAKTHQEIARRREAAGQYATDVEQALRNAQAAFRQEIPNAVSAGQTKDSYGNLEAVAQRWEARCRETFKGIENYRNTELKDTFLLENRTATWDAKAYRDRLNAVLEGWSSMCRKALDCKNESQYKQVEATYLKNQMEFWKNVEALDTLQKEINACQAKLQAKRQELSGMATAEGRAHAAEIKIWFNQDIMIPSKNIKRQAGALAAYFSSLLPTDDWDPTLPYNKKLGNSFLQTPEVRQLTPAYQEKAKAMVEDQNSKLMMRNMGNKKESLSRLKDKAEMMQGQCENLIHIEENDRLYKPLRVWGNQQ
ncbi:MAG: hypothetical protein IKX30_03365 [Victivallales bacterium]|nr:hypothetical protein [Victivallales bacterium]